MKNNNIYKKNDVVYWVDYHGILRCGTIYALETGRLYATDGDKVKIKERIDNRLTKYRVEVSKCWPTKEDCLNAEFSK